MRGDKHALGWQGGAIGHSPGEMEMRLILKLDVVDDGNVAECVWIEAGGTRLAGLWAVDD